jgi:polyisoprenoid-binding protein YceI
LPAGQREELAIEPRSSIGFTGGRTRVRQTGTFCDIGGHIALDPESIENSRVHIDIPIRSLRIAPERLRHHLLSSDFFDAEHFPTATFESTRIDAGGRATHTVTGNLTLRGHTHSLTFPADIRVEPHRVHARAEFTIDRRAFGIVYIGNLANDLIRNAVVVRFDVSARRRDALRHLRHFAR